MEITGEHFDELREAKKLLENPGFAAKLTNLIGKPIEKGVDALPEKWKGKLQLMTRQSLLKALEYVSKTFAVQQQRESLNAGHRIAAIASGAAGGAFGLAALAVELPVSTLIMLRSIMDIARSQGEDINIIESQLACLEVFALGGKTEGDDYSEVGYYAVRMAMARSMTEAAKYIAERGIAEKGAPAIVRFIAQITTRFGVIISEKAAAQAIPVAGAVAGASVNAVFISHFQNVAKGHFIVRKLEKIYGSYTVKEAYEALV